MAALTPSTAVYPGRHVIGDMVTRFYSMSGNNGDTFIVQGMGPQLYVDVSPTTAIGIGTTVAGNVITFVTGGAWAGIVQITSRWG